MACVDEVPVTPQYKLLQMHQYMSGEPLVLVEKLGFSDYACEAAKMKLERKYGGHRRRVDIEMDEIERYPKLHHDNAKDFEELADTLDIAVFTLKEAGRHSELVYGTLHNL